MGKFSFVLSNYLYKEYYLFKKQEKYNKDIVSNLLKFHCGEFLTNTKQLEEIGIDKEIEKTTFISLKKGGFTNQNLDELANKTDYKMILCTDRTDFPYINILSSDHQEPINSCIVGCYHRTVSRDKAKRHIKSLCRDACKIYLFDKYLSGGGNSIDALKSILPVGHKKVEIFYYPGHINPPDIAKLQAYNGTWDFVADTNILANSHHDRYIIIDNKMEIVLTSGFEFIESDAKELSYIVRSITKNRLLR